jgi:hypothetical protein
MYWNILHKDIYTGFADGEGDRTYLWGSEHGIELRLPVIEDERFACLG